MIKVTTEYINASESITRKSYILAKYGSYDKKAKTNIDNVVADSQAFSSLDKTYNEVKDTTYNYISCEPNRVILDGTFYFVVDKAKTNVNENIAYWSDILSKEDCTFESNPIITYNFSEYIEFTELTLYFQEVCSDFIVRYYYDGNIVATRVISGNEDLIVTTSSIAKNSEYFNKIEIEFVKTKKPYRYIKFNEIDFGIYQLFTDEQIKDMDIIDEMSIDSSSLSSNYLSLTIDDTKGEYDVLNPNNKLSDLEAKQEISIYHYLKVGSKMQEIPLGTFYIKDFESQRNTLNITAYDDTYFMNKIYYGSKFYNNAKPSEILKDLFDYFNYSNYEFENIDNVNSILLTGYVPNVEFKEALRLICEACGCVIKKTRLGVTTIFKPQKVESDAKVFGLNLIFTEQAKRNLFNNLIDMTVYTFEDGQIDYNILDVKLERDSTDKLTESKQYTITYGRYPVDSESVKVVDEEGNLITPTDYKIINTYATSCVIELNPNVQSTRIILRGTYYPEHNYSQQIKKEGTNSTTDYSISKVNNHLITKSNYLTIANWKLARNDIKFNFNTLVMPYIEVGDYCKYNTKYGKTYEFLPTRIEFTKSIKQHIEGE